MRFLLLNFKLLLASATPTPAAASWASLWTQLDQRSPALYDTDILILLSLALAFFLIVALLLPCDAILRRKMSLPALRTDFVQRDAPPLDQKPNEVILSLDSQTDRPARTPPHGLPSIRHNQHSTTHKNNQPED